ncbi:MAG: hypothetical protein ABI877_06310 [Gemmatimonadaceae bacterium]
MTAAGERTSGDSTIRAALAIRSVVLPALANGTVTPAGSALLAGTSEAAWRLFLRAECCAAPIAAALRRQGVFELLPSATAAIVRAAESRELQRSLSARAQLGQLDALAHAAGLSATVLKGGALAAEGAVIDLGDLDISSGDAERDALWSALIGCGYTAESTAGLTPAATTTSPREQRHAFGSHWRRLEMAGGLPIEIHREPLGNVADVTVPSSPWMSSDHATRVAGHREESGFALSGSTRPLRGFRSLVRRIGGAPLLDLLRHVVVQHTFRRGHIRDLIVVADAIGCCRAEELTAVRARCRRDAHSDELVAMLDQSTAIATGASIQDPEPTRRTVARKYALVSGREGWIARAVPRWPWQLAYVPLERASLRRFELASLLRDVTLDHPLYQLQRIRAHAPRLADLIGAMMATGYRTLLAGAVAGAGPLVRHRMKRLLDQEPPGAREGAGAPRGG